MKQQADAFPLLITGVVFSAFAFLNFDGYQLHVASPWGVGVVTGEPPLINWVHGWPIGCVVRSSIYSITAGRGVPVPAFTGEQGLYSRWPIDESPVIAFSGFAATCDLLFCLALLVGTFVGTRKLAGYLKLRFQFTLRSLLVFVFAFAVLLALREWIFASRFVLEAIALTATVFGSCMCLLAIPWPQRGRAAPQRLVPTQAT